MLGGRSQAAPEKSIKNHLAAVEEDKNRESKEENKKSIRDSSVWTFGSLPLWSGSLVSFSTF